jgi:hypothetical protein
MADLPQYYAVNDRPVVIVETPDGGADLLAIDMRTGELVPAREYWEFLTPGSGKDVDVLTPLQWHARVVAIWAQLAEH